jgi:hypothetical protein
MEVATEVELVVAVSTYPQIRSRVNPHVAPQTGFTTSIKACL